MLYENDFSSWDLFFLTGNVDAYLLTKELEQFDREEPYYREDHTEKSIE